VFYAIVAIGAQCKGLTAIVVPILAVLPDLFQKNRFRQQLNVRHVIALLIGAIIYFKGNNGVKTLNLSEAPSSWLWSG